MSSRRTRQLAAIGAAGLALAAVPAAAIAAPVTFVPWDGSTWRILDNGTNVVSTFAAPSFDDSTWKSYTTQAGVVMGYGETYSQVPPLSFGPNSSAKHPVTYFRTSFTVADPGSISALTLRQLSDDGIVVYLNGVEVHRRNMPAGAPIYGYTEPLPEVSGAAELFEEVVTIPTTSLLAGTNVLAVQVNQQRGASSDVSLKLALTAEQAETPVPMQAALPMLALVGGTGAAALLLGRRRRTAG